MNTKKVQGARSTWRGGYTLLFAMLTAALVLGVAIFILSVSKRQYNMAVTARESMYAIYAADSGIECMSLYSVSTTTNTVVSCDGTDTAFDAGQYILMSAPVQGFKNYPYRIANKVLPFSNGRCALITVTSGDDASDGTSKVSIESRGYNQCDSSGPLISKRTVERALRLTYR